MNLDERLTTTLRDRAGGDVDPAPIVAHARRRGQRIRLRRRAVAGAALCAVLLAVAAVVPWRQAPDAPAAPEVAALALPVSPDVAGALGDPDKVGAEWGTVHFAVGDLLDGAEYATWSTRPGIESVQILRRATFTLAATADKLDGAASQLESAGRPGAPVAVAVGGRPGTARADAGPAGGQTLWSVRWQPVGTLWARLDVYAGGADEATAAAARVSFDAAYRCVVPFELSKLPAGAQIQGCSLTLGARGGFAEGALMIGDYGRWLTIRAERTPPGMDAVTGDLAAGPYRVARAGDGLLEMLVQPCLVDLFLTDRGSGYTEQDGLLVLGGYAPVQDLDLDRPGSW
ncbi:hypothetical protein AB0J72_40150 [Dactylosporangium sp. NPDC049742]|uniref:hypothetical protein n=1 Tax=Dactylosporangium sp. NPDC049742 TaxID=3154737 RepID=UPI00342990D0